MAHEVVKRVGRRAYRYLVETYRDPHTRKVRSRWRYLGVASAPGMATISPLPRPEAGATRERLLNAFAALVETESYDAITAGMVAKRAGVAHGTFYRYFGDKRAAFVAALERLRVSFERDRPNFDGPLGTRADERQRVRRWVESMLGKPAEHPGLLRAFFDALEGDVELQRLRRERRAARTADLAGYLRRLALAKTAGVDDADALAAALTALLDGALRESVASGVSNPLTLTGVIAVFDRAIFSVRDGA